MTVPTSRQIEIAKIILCDDPTINNTALSMEVCRRLIAAHGRAPTSIRSELLAEARRIVNIPGRRGAPPVSPRSTAISTGDETIVPVETKDSLLVQALRSVVVAMTQEGISRIVIENGKVVVDRVSTTTLAL